MTIELKVPAAGESITEVVVVEWLKGEGSVANQDEALALIETDKANVEVLAICESLRRLAFGALLQATAAFGARRSCSQ